MKTKIKYNFSGKLWKYNGKGGWYFVSLPYEISKEIKENLKWQEEGWGRMAATAIINKLEWKTAIWFDKKSNTYLLPIKSDIRKKASCKLDDILKLSIKL